MILNEAAPTPELTLLGHHCDSVLFLLHLPLFQLVLFPTVCLSKGPRLWLLVAHANIPV